MKLRELLNITAVDNIIKIEGIKNRVKKDIALINCKNEYNIVQSEPIDNIIKSHGEYDVIGQHVNNNTLVILLRY